MPQKMFAVYAAARASLGLDPDDTPPTGEVGYACERLCRLLGVNPLEEHNKETNDNQQPAPAPTRRKKEPDAAPVATASQTVGLDPSA